MTYNRFSAGDRVGQRNPHTGRCDGPLGTIKSVDYQLSVTYEDGRVEEGNPADDRYLVEWDSGGVTWHRRPELI